MCVDSEFASDARKAVSLLALQQNIKVYFKDWDIPSRPGGDDVGGDSLLGHVVSHPGCTLDP